MLGQPQDADTLRAHGFRDVRPVDPQVELGPLTVTRTDGRHGTGELGASLGPVSGFVIDDGDGPPLYVAGDTIWCDEVRDALEQHRPRVVVVNAGGARFNEGDPIVMDVDDVRSVRAATDAEVVVVHLEAINHCVEPRSAYRAIDAVHVPDDGGTIEL